MPLQELTLPEANTWLTLHILGRRLKVLFELLDVTTKSCEQLLFYISKCANINITEILSFVVLFGFCIYLYCIGSLILKILLSKL